MSLAALHIVSRPPEVRGPALLSAAVPTAFLVASSAHPTSGIHRPRVGSKVVGGVLAAALLACTAARRCGRRRVRGARSAAGAGASCGGEIFIGIDFGTSGCRAACLESDGSLGDEASVAYGRDAGPKEWRKALHEVLMQLPRRSAAAAVCIDGTSATALLVGPGPSVGEPLAPPLMYDYACSREAVERCLAMVPSPAHVAASPTSTLAKVWEWQLGGVVPAGARLAHQADWLAALLHGGPLVTDYHNALKLGYDIEALQWPEWMLAERAVAELLPGRVATPGETVGHISAETSERLGLPQSCRVAAGTTDSIAAFLAAGTVEVGDAVTSLGTTLAVKLRSLTRVEDAASGIYSHRLGTAQWLVGGASNSGGGVLRQQLGDEAVAQLSARIDPERDSGLDYYPLPRPGERFPICDAALRPRLEPRPEDDALFLHGMLEGMARIEAKGYRRLEELGADPVRRVFTAGGGAKNEQWRRIRERLVGVPVQAAAWTQAACGSALLAKEGPALLG